MSTNFTKGILILALIAVAVHMAFFSPMALAQAEGNTPAAELTTLKHVGAGIAFGLAALGAGIAIASVGSASLSVIAEKPEMVTWGLVFTAIGEAIAIYGFVMAYLILTM